MFRAPFRNVSFKRAISLINYHCAGDGNTINPTFLPRSHIYSCPDNSTSWNSSSTNKASSPEILSKSIAAFVLFALAFFSSFFDLNASCEGKNIADKENRQKSPSYPELKDKKEEAKFSKKSTQDDNSKSNEEEVNKKQEKDGVKPEKENSNDKSKDERYYKEEKELFPEKSHAVTLNYAIQRARTLIHQTMGRTGAPGVSIAVSVNGKVVWAEGLGYADVENRVRCSSNTVMRIASISKTLTMAAVSRLCEEKKLDLDLPIQKYIPDFPVKKFKGKVVPITTRKLLSHTAGIRHYALRGEDDKPEKKEDNLVKISEVEAAADVKKKRESIRSILMQLAYPKEKKEAPQKKGEYNLEEYYFKENFKNINQALELFKNDELFFEPGKGFLYSTHGYTLASAVIESAAGKSFQQVMKQLFYEMGLDQTMLEDEGAIIFNRASYYVHDSNGHLKNAPYVDNSYKFAGGGILSTVVDLTKFGNAMLYSFQCRENSNDDPGFLSRSSMEEMWTPVKGAEFKNSVVNGKYGLGWEIIEGKEKSPPFCRWKRLIVSHSGCAVGASSYLLILPSVPEEINSSDLNPPSGVVVAVLTNMLNVNFSTVCREIAAVFEKLEDQSKILGSISGSKAKVFNVDRA